MNGHPFRMPALLVLAATSILGPSLGCRKAADKSAASMGSAEPRGPSSAPMGQTARVKQGTPLRVQIDNEPPSLVSLIHPDVWAERIASGNILEPLLAHDPRPPHRLKGVLATRWQAKKGGRVWEFWLRPGVQWHDGSPFSGQDVRFTIDRILDEKVRAVSVRASLAPFIDKVELVAPLQLRIHCKRPAPMLPELLSTVSILPAGLMAKSDLNVHPLLNAPVGTGPYRFLHWRRGQSIGLVRNDAYWGPAAGIARVEFYIVRDPEAALRLAEQGRLDFVPRLHGAQVARRVRGNPRLAGFRLLQQLTPGTSFIAFNHQRAFFADQRVRRALAMLLDVPTIIERLMFGYGRRLGSLYWPGDPDWDPSVKAIPFDPQQAASLLSAAGWIDRDGDGVRERGGRKLAFTFALVAASKTTARWATLYQQELKRAGVQLELKTLEWADYLRRLRAHDFDMAPLGMALGGLYTDLYLQLHSSQGRDGQNYGAYKNPQMDKMLDELRLTFDPPRRRALALQLQRSLAAEVPVIPLFTMVDPCLVSKSLSGVYPSPLWFQLREWRFGPR